MKLLSLSGLLVALLLIATIPAFAVTTGQDPNVDNTPLNITASSITVKPVASTALTTARQAVVAKRNALINAPMPVLKEKVQAWKALRGNNTPAAVAQRQQLRVAIVDNAKDNWAAHIGFVKAKLDELGQIAEIPADLTTEVNSLDQVVPTTLTADQVPTVSAEYVAKWGDIRRKMWTINISVALKRATTWLNEKATPAITKLKATKLYTENAGFKTRVDKLDQRVIVLKTKITELEGKDLTVKENFQAAKRVILQTRTLFNKLNAFFKATNAYMKNRAENKPADIQTVVTAADQAVTAAESPNLSTEVTAADTQAATDDVPVAAVDTGTGGST